MPYRHNGIAFSITANGCLDKTVCTSDVVVSVSVLQYLLLYVGLPEIQCSVMCGWLCYTALIESSDMLCISCGISYVL